MSSFRFSSSHSRFLIPDSRLFFPLLFTITLFSSFASAASDTANYDTTWTFVYDGGLVNDGRVIEDRLFDVKELPDHGNICVGNTRDSVGSRVILLMKLSSTGRMAWKKTYYFRKGGGGNSIIITKNGDFVIGGYRYADPFIMRTDTLGNIKWTNWVYDSIKDQPKYLSRSATINCVRETSRGTFICAAGDEYPFNNGQKLDDYAAVLIFDSSKGQLIDWGPAGGQAGYQIGGFCIGETSNKNYILAGNQSALYFDSTLTPLWEKKYSIWLEGVGTVTNNISRCKTLRDGTPMVAGQAYEGDCWTRYGRLYYDAWWSPISYADGANTTWDTAGVSGHDDIIYDFTQLIDGRLAFVGTCGPGVWSFVTDSTGKHVLWQKLTNIPYKSDNGTGATPFSVCATADSGFTVVGQSNTVDSLGGMNAFAAHFVPKPVPVVARKFSPTQMQKKQTVQTTIVGNNVLFTINGAKPSRLTIFNSSGRVVADVNTQERAITWKSPGAGVYLYQLQYANGIQSGMVVKR